MSQPSVAEYTLQRLSTIGIDRVFGVPGDYAFSVDDAVEQVEGLDWAGCANELNAAYAADGYARIRGAAVLSTTYGVGELSALNGVMGAKAHRVPVFHIVGMPRRTHPTPRSDHPPQPRRHQIRPLPRYFGDSLLCAGGADPG